MIQVTDLVFEYPGHRALSHISFSVARGGSYALVGPNGAGKTTLLKCLAALLPPFSGQIVIGGADIVENPSRTRSLVGYMPDFFGLYENLTVRRILTYFAMAHHLENPGDRAVDMAKTLDLEYKIDNKVSALSRGMRQRVGIGTALIHDPQLLLLDEPASGLDPEARRRLSDLMVWLNKQGKTLVVSSHILSELDQYAADVLIMENGRLTSGVMQNQAQATGQVVVHAANPLPDTGDRISGVLGFECKEQSPGVYVVFMPIEPMKRHDALNALLKAGIRVTDFFMKRQTLEEAYLERKKTVNTTHKGTSL